MPAAPITYNERAWAIDLISEVNAYAATHRRAIVRAGGEHTISLSGGKSLFPDVLLFGDAESSSLKQGWELKLPDTPLTDAEFVSNAEKKARALEQDSFLLWNAKDAALYRKDETTGAFAVARTWSVPGVTSRTDVLLHRANWVSVLHEILGEVNHLLETGVLRGSTPIHALSEHLFVEFLQSYTGAMSAAMETEFIRNARFADEAEDWWVVHEIEHRPETLHQALAKVNLVNWLNRFLFAHYLKSFHSAAADVETLTPASTVDDGVRVFESISLRCDFMNVFRPSVGQRVVDAGAWSALLALNAALKDFQLERLDQEIFQSVLDSALASSRKRMSGQFATPKPLSELLVRLTVENREGHVIDPCCGTGTIARAVYDLKRSVHLSPERSLATTWGSDKFAFPLQLCSIALSDPQGIDGVVQVFKHDAFELCTGDVLCFTDPSRQAEVERDLPAMHAIVSNLPFVRFEAIKAANPAAERAANALVDEFQGSAGLGTKSDLYAYLIFHLRSLLEQRGRVGVVVSNSWLGTDWGSSFRVALQKAFKVLYVVSSGAGRWFSNASVVATTLVLEKRDSLGPDGSDEVMTFAETCIPMDEWTAPALSPQDIARSIRLGRPSPAVALNRITPAQARAYESLGLSWGAFFSDLAWLDDVSPKLAKAADFFEIGRGERRGWDELFYPKRPHGIEAEFIRPVLLSSRSVAGLVASPDGEAFCCSEDEATLYASGMTGALQWISRFRHATNTRGKPLVDVLSSGGNRWYELNPRSLADLVVSMNPDRRMAVHKLEARAFVNQRLIRFTAREGSPTALLHALMNSSLGLFFIEASGFGRGEGALDLNSNKLARGLRVLNPNLLPADMREAIATAFEPLLRRKLQDLESELASADRLTFDQTVFQAFGLEDALPKVRVSLLRIYRARQSARD